MFGNGNEWGWVGDMGQNSSFFDLSIEDLSALLIFISSPSAAAFLDIASDL